MKKIAQIIRTEVLIIGGGGAAIRAAIAAAEAGVKTLVVLKGCLGASGATTHKCCEIAGFNVPGSGDMADGKEPYLKDILDAALGMAEPELAALLADKAGDRFKDLCGWGLQPKEKDGRPVIMKGCYSNYRRGYTIEGHGEPIMKALLSRMAELPIDTMENSMAIDLVLEDGICCGALLLTDNNQFLLVHAGAVILATGGASQVFLNNLNPPDVCGDGYSLAFDVGAELMNMEFMQAGVGFFHPVKSLFNTYLWAGLPELKNRQGESFLSKYLPAGITEKDVMIAHCRHFPFSSRDISRYIEIGIQKEIETGGGTERMCLPVSFEHYSSEYIQALEYDADLKQLWTSVLQFFANRGVDLIHDEIEITCVAQAVNGGIRIDANAMSSIPGLFAAGECASGPHGADRLGGNMMGTCQVFGEIAGNAAAHYARTKRQREPLYDIESSEKVSILYKVVPTEQMTLELQRCAQTKLFICRTEEKLIQMLETAAILKKRLWEGPEGTQINRDCIELYHKLNTAQIMTAAAIQRKESRGSHYREDYPEQDDLQFGKPIILKK